jgi:splicing factor 3A subunit 1
MDEDAEVDEDKSDDEQEADDTAYQKEAEAVMLNQVPGDYVDDYEEASKGASGRMQKCPICGENIPVDELSEHMRIELLDPRWKEQKQALRNRQNESSLSSNADISANLGMLAKTRSDVFVGRNEARDEKEDDAREKRALEYYEQHRQQLARENQAKASVPKPTPQAMPMPVQPRPSMRPTLMMQPRPPMQAPPQPPSNPPPQQMPIRPTITAPTPAPPAGAPPGAPPGGPPQQQQMQQGMMQQGMMGMRPGMPMMYPGMRPGMPGNPLSAFCFLLSALCSPLSALSPIPLLSCICLLPSRFSPTRPCLHFTLAGMPGMPQMMSGMPGMPQMMQGGMQQQAPPQAAPTPYHPAPSADDQVASFPPLLPPLLHLPSFPCLVCLAY